MKIREAAEHEFLKITEDARKELKYNPASAKLMIDIIENGETFSREKWLSIYRNKDVPWRADKNLQEVMVRTKGFPDDLCEKILSCAFNKRIYKAALARSDISLKNIDIALAGLSERELTKALMNKELSELTVNQIAKRAINRLTYDSERVPDKYELIALEQMTDKHAAQTFLEDVGFEEIGEKIVTMFANNEKLEEVRDTAFNLGCNPESISSPYTPYMEEIVINGALDAYFDESTPYRAKQDAKDMILTAIERHQLSQETESKIIKEFVNESKKKYYGDCDVLACLLSNTNSVKIMQEGILAFPSFAPELIFINKETPFPIVAPNVPMELKKVYEMPLNTRSKIASFNAYMNGLKHKLENSWKNAILGDSFYKEIVKPNHKLVAGKAEFLALIASAPGTPTECLDGLLQYRVKDPSEQIVKSIAIMKMDALLTKKLNEEKFNHNLPKMNITKFMKYMNDAVMYEGSHSVHAFREMALELFAQPEFLEQKEQFIKAVQNAKNEIHKHKTHTGPYEPASSHEDAIFKRVEIYYGNILDELEKSTKILTALNKRPAECDKEEAEIAAGMLLASVLNCAKQRPIEMILGFEDAKAEFIALKERAYELELKEGKVESKSDIEEILSDGSVMIDAPKATPPTPTKETPIEVFEI